MNCIMGMSEMLRDLVGKMEDREANAMQHRGSLSPSPTSSAVGVIATEVQRSTSAIITSGGHVT